MARLCSQCRSTIIAPQWPRCPHCGYVHPNPTPRVDVAKDGIVRMQMGDFKGGPLFRVCNVNGQQGLAMWDKVARVERFFDITSIQALITTYCQQ